MLLKRSIKNLFIVHFAHYYGMIAQKFVDETNFLLVENSFFSQLKFSVKKVNIFSSQIIVVSSQNNVRKYRTKGHKQV